MAINAACGEHVAQLVAILWRRIVKIGGDFSNHALA
jgi:hypothetical protein